eukprot:RCo041043
MAEAFVALPEGIEDHTLFHVRTLVNTGNSLYRSGHYQDALQYFSRALRDLTSHIKSTSELTPSGKMLLSNLYSRHAACANKLQNYPQVISDADQMIALGYQKAKALVRRGGALLNLDRPAEAVQAYE